VAGGGAGGGGGGGGGGGRGGRHGTPDDRRSNLVVLTRKGRTLSKRVFPGQAEALAEAFASLSANDRRQLSRLLAKVSANLVEDGDA